MKKKVMLSEEALKTLLSTEETVPLVPKAEGTTPEVLPEAPTTAPEAEDTDTQAEFEAFKATAEAEKVELTEKLTHAEAVNVELTEKLAASDAAKILLTAGASDLKEIVIGQISKMRIGLSLAAVDMAKWTFEAVVTEFNSTSESFMKSINVGSVIPEEKTAKAETAIPNSHAASEFKSLGF